MKQLQVNTNEKINANDAVSELNKQNLTLCLYIISNMVSQSKNARLQFLEDKEGENLKGNHFQVLLGWYIMPEFELLFEPFSAILTALTHEEDIRVFLLN